MVQKRYAPLSAQQRMAVQQCRSHVETGILQTDGIWARNSRRLQDSGKTPNAIDSANWR